MNNVKSNGIHCDSGCNYFDDLIQRKESIRNDGGLFSTEERQKCFRYFDKDGDGSLNTREFHQMCSELFSYPNCEQQWTTQDTEKVHGIQNKEVTQGKQIDSAVFESLWGKLITPVLAPKCALVVVDVQNDFISGTLALVNCPAKQDGAEVVPVINRMVDTVQFEKIIYSHDWHPEDHISFHNNRNLRNCHHSSKIPLEAAKVFDTVVFDVDNLEPVEQILWPAHCVQKTVGAQLHCDLKIVDDHIQAFKGTNPVQDCYSVLYPKPEPNNSTSGDALAARLRDLGITDLFVCGLAFDICVAETALDSCRLGFRTIVVEDACRGVDDTRIRNTRINMKNAGCVFVNSEEVSKMVSGLYRHPGLAHVSANDHPKPGSDG